MACLLHAVCVTASTGDADEDAMSIFDVRLCLPAGEKLFPGYPVLLLAKVPISHEVDGRRDVWDIEPRLNIAVNGKECGMIGPSRRLMLDRRLSVPNTAIRLEHIWYDCARSAYVFTRPGQHVVSIRDPLTRESIDVTIMVNAVPCKERVAERAFLALGVDVTAASSAEVGTNAKHRLLQFQAEHGDSRYAQFVNMVLLAWDVRDLPQKWSVGTLEEKAQYARAQEAFIVRGRTIYERSDCSLIRARALEVMAEAYSDLRRFDTSDALRAKVIKQFPMSPDALMRQGRTTGTVTLPLGAVGAHGTTEDEALTRSDTAITPSASDGNAQIAVSGSSVGVVLFPAILGVALLVLAVLYRHAKSKRRLLSENSSAWKHEHEAVNEE